MSDITLTGWAVLDQARTMLRTAIAGVPADGWELPTPCSAWTVTQVLQHAALDQEAWGAMVGGTQMPRPWARASTPGTSRWRPARARR